MTPTVETSRPDLLRLNGVSVFYGAHRAVSEVSVSVSEGKAIAIVGANGAGKSSLARGITGLVQVRSGSVHLAGLDISGYPAHKIRRLGVSYLPESRGVACTLTVADNLRMAARWLVPRSECNAAVSNAFEMFPLLADRRRQLAGSLSGGEQQMLALARALAGSPKLLIADEPSLGLAPLVVDSLFERLHALKAAGVTVVLIEQFIHRALAFADEVIVLQRGSLVLHSPTSGVNEDEILKQYLGDESKQDRH